MAKTVTVRPHQRRLRNGKKVTVKGHIRSPPGRLARRLRKLVPDKVTIGMPPVMVEYKVKKR